MAHISCLKYSNSYIFNNIDKLNFTSMHYGFDEIYLFANKTLFFDYCKISVDGISVYEKYDVPICCFSDSSNTYNCDKIQNVKIEVLFSHNSSVVVWVFNKDPNMFFDKIVCISCMFLFVFVCIIICCKTTNPTKNKIE